MARGKDKRGLFETGDRFQSVGETGGTLPLFPLTKKHQPLIDYNPFLPGPFDNRKQIQDRIALAQQHAANGLFFMVDMRSEFVPVQFVLGPLTEQEQDEWIGKIAWKLDLSGGQLSCDWEVFSVPPGIYDVNVFCYLPGEAAQQCLQTLGEWNERASFKKNLGSSMKATREETNAWKYWEEREYIEAIVQLLPSTDRASMPKIDTSGWGPNEYELDLDCQLYFTWECRKPERCPTGIIANPTEEEDYDGESASDEYASDEYDAGFEDDDMDGMEDDFDGSFDGKTVEFTTSWELADGFNAMHRKTDHLDLAPIEGGPIVAAPGGIIRSLEALASAAVPDSSCDVMLILDLPKNEKLHKAWSADPELVRINTAGDRVELGFAQMLQPPDNALLQKLPVSGSLELRLASLTDYGPAAQCRFAGTLTKEGWCVESSYPPFRNDELRTTFDLAWPIFDESFPIQAGDTDEQSQITKWVEDFFDRASLRKGRFKIRDGQYNLTDEIIRKQLICELFRVRILNSPTANESYPGWKRVADEAISSYTPPPKPKGLGQTKKRRRA